MHAGKWVLISGLAGLTILCQEARANSYTIVDLGNFRYPAAINGAGEMAGNSGDPGTKGLRYRDGKWHKLASQSKAFAINDSGSIAGGQPRIPLAEIWKPHGDSKIIDPPLDTHYPMATGINSGNVVIGTYVPDSTHCFIKQPSKKSVDMGFLPQGTECIPMAINGSGQVTGESTTADGTFHAFIWTSGKMTDLGVLAGTFESVGSSINESGVVVGSSQVDSRNSTAVIWSGGIVSLDPGRAYASSAATAINKSRVIVGWAVKVGKSTRSAARFADDGNALLNDEVVNLGDWDLTEATGVNDAGVIIGNGVRKTTGEVHGFELMVN